MREFHEEKQMINEPAHKIINQYMYFKNKLQIFHNCAQCVLKNQIQIPYIDGISHENMEH